ncbi:hypothetical protein MKQ68_13915 [Chitinophaga horti]|uniref:Outer membrane protein beta-barrel domain-containing protein n=1 Tax=Chitinophaga horti TaxID=2920382 RepID=A0ABY6IZ50_9BACT|nr:hypothetical protein [Chitinophaga horti]UYQ91187.1 hypothetical protein MKQ68_13915 [Chitinophaga horti]
MKKIIIALTLVLAAGRLSAQEATEITAKNSWLKAGISAGVPIGEVAPVSAFTLGGELKGQLMTTPHWGIGLTAGYNHFFPKDDHDHFGTVPLGGFARWYPKASGFFVGTDIGYSLVTGPVENTGGFFVKPQLGYHNYNWNFFAFYNGVYRSAEHGSNIQAVGIGTTYNIRFK